MSVFKQGEKWWYEFYVDGKRYRSSTRTTDISVAELIESDARAQSCRRRLSSVGGRLLGGYQPDSILVRCSRS